MLLIKEKSSKLSCDKIAHQLSLLLELSTEGFEEAIQYKCEEDLVFLKDLKDKNLSDIAAYRKELLKQLYSSL